MLRLFALPELRKKVFFTLFVIFVFRLLAHVPVPGVDIAAIRQYLNQSALLGLFDYFSGGGFQNFSIVTLGVSPYINASIIIQLLTVMIPSFEELSKEGDTGREKLNQYTKYLTVPLSIFQSYGVYFLLLQQGVISSLNKLDLFVLIATLTVGGIILVWIGDLVTEYGIGNGVSLIIFVGIISRLPQATYQFIATLDSTNITSALVFAVLAVLVILGVVLVNEGTRNIPLEYGRRSAGIQRVTNYLPIKVNQAGVIPIIFAVSVVMIPSLISSPLQAVSIPWLQNLGFWLAKNFSFSSASYNLTYFLLVVAFTYFYTSVQFDPAKISDDVKKRGGFIPGVRPGIATTSYLRGVITRITLAGALFLGTIAVLPYLIQHSLGGAGTYSIGGTGLLIVVSVVLETVRQTESLLVSKNYDSFLR
ncbi:preprotein translocase subunit SecY [candidate division WWE3 bacterium]|nr:preprotein translocase subunit SecY [candidate division WWE3 bacterium]